MKHKYSLYTHCFSSQKVRDGTSDQKEKIINLENKIETMVGSDKKDFPDEWYVSVITTNKVIL